MITPTSILITHTDGDSILKAWWPSHRPAEQVRGDYSELLARARAYGRCRFWLIKVRQAVAYSPVTYDWYGRTYAPMVVRALGHPVFVAYCYEHEPLSLVHTPINTELQHVCAASDFHFRSFDSEARALDWLRHQQEHDPAPGDGPAPFDNDDF